MTPLPKKKHTRGRSGRRRGGQTKPGLPEVSVCSSCKKIKIPHKACPHCGHYKD